MGNGSSDQDVVNPVCKEVNQPRNTTQKFEVVVKVKILTG